MKIMIYILKLVRMKRSGTYQNNWYQDASEFRVEHGSIRCFKSGTNGWIRDQFS